MINVKGNAWKVAHQYDALCLTTNGTVKKDHTCVMGRGIAAEAKRYLPGIDRVLGSSIIRNGNKVNGLGEMTIHGVRVALIAMPVKHNWYEEADIKLISLSCEQLLYLADRNGYKKVLLPRPGCGNGKLKWEEVEPVISSILDDRFYCITF